MMIIKMMQRKTRTEARTSRAIPHPGTVEAEVEANGVVLAAGRKERQ